MHNASRDGALKHGARSGLGYIVRPRDPDRVRFDLSHGLDRSLPINNLSVTVPLHYVCVSKEISYRVIRKGEAAQGGAEGLTNMLQSILHYRQALFIQFFSLVIFYLSNIVQYCVNFSPTGSALPLHQEN